MKTVYPESVIIDLELARWMLKSIDGEHPESDGRAIGTAVGIVHQISNDTNTDVDCYIKALVTP